MYITNETEIANLALDLISAGTVTNITEPTTTTEEVLNRWYDITRLKVLREHPWNFAAKRIILSASATAPDYGYTSAFPIPSDFVRLLSLQNSEGYNIASTEYEMEYVGTQRCILYNAEAGELRIRYVHDIQDVSKFDPAFIQLFVHELALAIAYKGTESNSNIERIKAIGDEIKRMAKAIDGQEKPPILVRRSRNIFARKNYFTREDRISFE